MVTWLVVLALLYAHVAGLVWNTSVIRQWQTLNAQNQGAVIAVPLVAKAVAWLLSWLWLVLWLAMLISRAAVRAGTPPPAAPPEIWLVPKDGQGPVH